MDSMSDVAGRVGTEPRRSKKKTMSLDEQDKSNSTKERLVSYRDRIERLEAEKKALSEDIADLYQEVKSGGYDVGALRKVVAYRKKDPSKAEDADAMYDFYKRVLT